MFLLYSLIFQFLLHFPLVLGFFKLCLIFCDGFDFPGLLSFLDFRPCFICMILLLLRFKFCILFLLLLLRLVGLAWARLLSSLAVLLVLPVVVAVNLTHQKCCERMVLLAMAIHAQHDHKCANDVHALPKLNEIHMQYAEVVITTHSDRFLPNDL